MYVHVHTTHIFDFCLSLATQARVVTAWLSDTVLMYHGERRQSGESNPRLEALVRVMQLACDAINVFLVAVIT